MATPPMSDDLCREALAALAQAGNQTEAAKALGLPRCTLQSRLKKAYERGLHLSGGVKAALENTGLGVGEAKLGWRRVQNEDGSFDTVMWKADKPTPEDLIERIRVAFESIPAALVMPAPETCLAGLCTVYPVMDAHVGMHAWGRETGAQDYDIKSAGADMARAFGKVTAITPDSAEAVVLFGGDFFHADDNRSETPQNRHKLDTDTRHWKVLETGVHIAAHVIERLAEKHERVHARVLRGNHDEHSHLVLAFALAERYRDNARITVEREPRDIFMRQWGRCAIFAHHGDKAPPERLTLYLSDVCPFWSETRHRYALTGHVHRDQARDIGPLRWESLRAFAPPDAYAAGMGYAARRALQALTFDKQDGLVLRAMDPIE